MILFTYCSPSFQSKLSPISKGLQTPDLFLKRLANNHNTVLLQTIQEKLNNLLFIVVNFENSSFCKQSSIWAVKNYSTVSLFDRKIFTMSVKILLVTETTASEFASLSLIIRRTYWMQTLGYWICSPSLGST